MLNSKNILQMRFQTASLHRYVIGILVVCGMVTLMCYNSLQKIETSSPVAPCLSLPSNVSTSIIRDEIDPQINASTSIIPDEIDPKILDIYRQQIPQRKQYFRAVPRSSNSYYVLYSILVPEVFCRDLVRIGFIGDGGKWICNPLMIQNLPDCVVYSLGTHERPTFEEALQSLSRNKCRVRALDKDAQSKKTLKRISNVNGVFMKALIAGETNRSMDQYTFKDVLSNFGDTRVDILKIDIEGAEFEIQDELISVPICQLLIEIHSNVSRNALNLLQKFSRNGFYLFSYEVNGWTLEASEYSFIHQDCFKDYGIKTIYGKYLS